MLGHVEAPALAHARGLSKGPLTGRVWVVSGRDGTKLLDLLGTRAGEGFGIGFGAAGDVDGDGRPDLVVGSWQCAEAAPAGGTLLSGRDGPGLGTATGKLHVGAFLVRRGCPRGTAKERGIRVACSNENRIVF